MRGAEAPTANAAGHSGERSPPNLKRRPTCRSPSRYARTHESCSPPTARPTWDRRGYRLRTCRGRSSCRSEMPTWRRRGGRCTRTSSRTCSRRRRAVPRLDGEASILQVLHATVGGPARAVQLRQGSGRRRGFAVREPRQHLSGDLCARGIFGVASDLSVLHYERYFAIRLRRARRARRSACPVRFGARRRGNRAQRRKLARNRPRRVLRSPRIHVATMRERATRARRKTELNRRSRDRRRPAADSRRARRFHPIREANSRGGD